ncbi:MAG: HAMP domain-containing sensor histidine kinase [Methanoregula sp.]|jgi:signal transduction histidine kinase|uniref:sensor histidine kinase n=1 Tax=Methanoregula sp. TaxID=2052170 RepID=UPI003D0C00A6
MDLCARAGSWWKALDSVKPYALAILILAGLGFELVIHYLLKISIVYTHFYYLIIVVAGLWYGRKAIWVALFFGVLHIAVSWVLAGSVTPDAILRALMLILVAFIVGSVVEMMNCYRDELEVKMCSLAEVNERLKFSEQAFANANRKLRLLSGVTRHDIKNQLQAVERFLELSKVKVTDPDILRYIEKEEAAAQTIRRQIEFTRNYEEIGVRAPEWQDLSTVLKPLSSLLPEGRVGLHIDLPGLEVFADPLLVKVFENLVDNSLRHGERVRHIAITSLQYGPGDLALVYEDDGIGVHEEEKQKIFERGFGKNTGLGLFLSDEILTISGFSIQESGTYGKGARFEISVPKGKYRFTGKDLRKTS